MYYLMSYRRTHFSNSQRPSIHVVHSIDTSAKIEDHRCTITNIAVSFDLIFQFAKVFIVAQLTIPSGRFEIVEDIIKSCPKKG